MIRTAFVVVAVIGALFTSGSAHAQVNVEQIVAQKIQPILPKGGVAVAVGMNGKTSFYNYGMADNAQNRPVTADSIFNLGSVGKVFATTLLAQAVRQGELSLDDPVAKYVTELQRGGDIRRITLGQLASHTSGLPRVPQQYETWHKGRYTWPDFVRFLNSWKADPKHEPGQQYLYSNAAMVLLRVALERRFNARFATLMHQRLTGPLGMTSTALPLPRDLLGRAVQGYGPMGRPIGWPGEEGGTFKWPGAGQIYSSPHDMATFLAANLGELSDHRLIENDMALAQQPVFTVGPRLKLGLAWQNVSAGNFTIIDNGGLDSTSTYRICSAAEAGDCYSDQSRKATRHRHWAANLARVGTRPIRAIKRGRAEPGRRLIRSLKALLLYSYYYFTSSVAFFDVLDRLRDLAQ